MMRKSGDCAFSVFLPSVVAVVVVVFADVDATRAGGVVGIAMFEEDFAFAGGGAVDWTDIDSAIGDSGAPPLESCAAMELGAAVAGIAEAPQPVPARTSASIGKRRCVFTPGKRERAEDLTVALAWIVS
jgi:hypothetical protein